MQFDVLILIVECVLDYVQILVERVFTELSDLGLAEVSVRILHALILRDWLSWISPLDPRLESLDWKLLMTFASQLSI